MRVVARIHNVKAMLSTAGRAAVLAGLAALCCGCSDDPSAPGNGHPGDGGDGGGAAVEWSWFNPTPQGNSLRAVWAEGFGNAIAVGDVITVLRRNGASWNPADPKPATADFTGVWVSPLGRIYLTDMSGKVHEYDGATWTDWAGTSVRLNGVFGVPAGAAGDIVYVVGAFGYVARQASGMWTEIRKPAADELYAVWAAAPDAVFAVGGNGLIGRFDGAAWTLMTSGVSDHLDDIWGFSANDIWVAGQGPRVLHFDGADWKLMTLDNVIGDVRSVWGPAPNDVYAVTTWGDIAHYDGNSWARAAHSSVALHSVRGQGGDAYIVGDAGRILENIGGVWTRIDQGPTSTVTDIWPVSDNELYACTELGEMLHFTGGGYTSTSEPNCEFNRIWGTAPDSLYVAGRCAPGGLWTGVVMRYDGTAFVPETIIDSEVTSLWGSSSTNIYAVTSWGTITHFDGKIWQVTGPEDGIYYDVWGHAPDSVYVVGAEIMPDDSRRGIVQRFDGSEWTKIVFDKAAHLRGVWGRSGDDVYVVGDFSAAFHYDGRTWVELEVPALSQLFAVDGYSDGAAYVAGTNGYLFRIEDEAGQLLLSASGTRHNFKSVRTGPGIVWAGGEHGAILWQGR